MAADIEDDDRQRLRLRILGLVAISLFGALFARLWFLQVLEREQLQSQARTNTIRFVPEQAPRGRILDVNGKVLVHTRGDEADAVPIAAGAGMTKTMSPRQVDYQALRANDPAVEFQPLPRIDADIGDFYRNVLAAADGREPLLVKNEEVLRTMRLLQAIEESHRERQVVAFESAEQEELIIQTPSTRERD